MRDEERRMGREGEDGEICTRGRREGDIQRGYPYCLFYVEKRIILIGTDWLNGETGTFGGGGGRRRRYGCSLE